ncbi:SAF domain-containing protein [Glaesserella sp.]|uniref:SAF domain-containing protein n=1 Tax=Glaesserella sp. TaxID=2094731 RepID=UPI0035A051CE
MNYRALFIISILILVIGVGGLFLLPSSSEETTTQAPPPPPVEKVEEKKVIEVLVATAVTNRDLTKGTLLQADDYTLSQMKVEETSPLVQSDLTDLINRSETGSLQGFLVAENLTSGSLITKNSIISPDDSRFLISSLDPKQEVAFRVYIREPEQYILDTLRHGDFVSVFTQQPDSSSRKNTDKLNLIKLADNLRVLQVKIFKTDEVTESQNSVTKTNDYLGYVSIQVNAAKVKEFYSLESKPKLIVLPSHQEEKTNHRGTFVRELRGQ